jgi:DNA-binding transcriptional regulator YdaS (Cro superfamily)
MKFQQLVDFFGSQVAAAQALGVTQPTLSNWKARGSIPKLQQLRIEHATKGKLRAAAEILPERVSNRRDRARA